MNKRFAPLAVDTTPDGEIRIVQDEGLDDPQIVVITREQVPLLVALLREAEAELESGPQTHPAV